MEVTGYSLEWSVGLLPSVLKRQRSFGALEPPRRQGKESVELLALREPWVPFLLPSSVPVLWRLIFTLFLS